jgi:ribosomal protein L24
MKKIFLASIMMLFCITTATADVTINIDVTQVGPIDLTSNTVKEKVGKDEQSSYRVVGSYNGLPPMYAGEKVTGQSWTYTISSGLNVTCSPESGSTESATFTASSSYSGTYTITITMKLIFTIAKYKSDMQTVESTRQSDEYSKTTAATLDVWGKLQINAPDYLPVQSEYQQVTITANATLTGGTLTLTATDKLKLYENRTSDNGSNSLTLTLTNNIATCYLASSNSPSENTSDQTLTASYSGTNVESTTKDLTVYKLTIEAPNKMVDIGNGNFAVPVMYNDDHDCGLEYTANWNCGNNCSKTSLGSQYLPDTHRELEPVWDYLYAGIYAEDDLVAVKVEIKPTDMAGDVTVKPSGSNIRIWKQSNKGDKNSIITEKIYNVSELPQTIYVEGIEVGADSVTAKYTPPQNKTIAQTKTLSIEVVSLVEEQNGTRKIINNNATPIDFTVKGGLFFRGKFAWTVPNHNNTASIGSSSSISVTYGASNCNVTLPEDAAHRRFTTTISVSIDGKLTLDRTIRVAQATYQGTAVAAGEYDRRIEVIGLATSPSGFANTELPDVVDTQFTQEWFEKNIREIGQKVPRQNL